VHTFGLLPKQLGAFYQQTGEKASFFLEIDRKITKFIGSI
jgi:hypothetical protein